jgi:hypothetical protein
MAVDAQALENQAARRNKEIFALKRSGTLSRLKMRIKQRTSRRADKPGAAAKPPERAGNRVFRRSDPVAYNEADAKF